MFFTFVDFNPSSCQSNHLLTTIRLTRWQHVSLQWSVTLAFFFFGIKKMSFFYYCHCCKVFSIWFMHGGIKLLNMALSGFVSVFCFISSQHERKRPNQVSSLQGRPHPNAAQTTCPNLNTLLYYCYRHRWEQSPLNEVTTLLYFCTSVVEQAPDQCQHSRITPHLPKLTQD